MTSFILVGVTVFLLIFQSFPTEALEGQTSQEVRLTGRLLKGYVTSARPVRKDDTPVSVTTFLSFNQLIDIDEQQQVMTAAIWLIVKWTDEYLVWNRTELGVDSIALSPQDIWMPDLTLINNANDQVNTIPVDKPLIVDSSGHVQWFQIVVTKSQCILNGLYFPFDVQTCPIILGSWVYDLSKLELSAEIATGDFSNFIHNGVWEVEDIPARNGTFACIGSCKKYSTVTYYILLKRFPLFFVVQLYVPCFLFMIMSLMVFYLPCEAGEKTSFAVTMLLSFTVFMLIASDYLPHSSTVPIITQYFTGSLVLLGLCVLTTVITLEVHHRGDYGYLPPKWLKRLTLHYLAYGMCLQFRPRHETSWKYHFASEHQNPKSSSNRTSCALRSYLKVGTDNAKTKVEETEHTSVVTSRNTGRKTEHTDTIVSEAERERNVIMKEDFCNDWDQDFCRNEWLKVAAVLNRTFLVLFLILAILLQAYPFIRYFGDDHHSHDISDAGDLRHYEHGVA